MLATLNFAERLNIPRLLVMALLEETSRDEAPRSSKL